MDSMESANSTSGEPQTRLETAPSPSPDSPEKWFSERFDSLLPRIQERWPEVAKQTLEATRGSLDEVIKVISQQSSSNTPSGIRDQLEDLINAAGERTKDFAEQLEPLEKQLEELLDDLNSTLRPQIESPIRKKPLLAIAMATGIGIFLGLLLSGGRKS